MVNLKRIKALCNEAGITLKKLSDKTKISQTALTMAMHRNSTTLETLEKIAHFFGISVGYFFGEDDCFMPIREAFEKFDNDLKLSYNYIITTFKYCFPDFKMPISIEDLKNCFGKMSEDVANMLVFSMSKLIGNPVHMFLNQFGPKTLLKMASDGVISQDTADFVICARNYELFESKEVRVLIGEKAEPNFWYKVSKGLASIGKTLK
ncbi:MAG: helix-turn-helix transcriptional regulator [Bacteroidales bacterium]|nr:helix-turn-helix transcriptional regulator [Bacteroidales bacterium]